MRMMPSELRYKRNCLILLKQKLKNFSMHAYAWPDDPIVNALIPQSGAAGLVQTDASTGASNWFKLASKVGCGNQTDEATLECMRRQEYSVLIKAIKGKAESRVGLPSISFGPMIDNKIVFADYQERAAAGKFAKRVKET